MFLEQLANSAQDLCGLGLEQPILLGVSGGADSLALMYGLGTLGYSLVIAHVDHALRTESQDEAKFVRQIADSQGWPFISENIDVRSFAKTHKQSIEEAARHLRYQFLFEQARLHHCQAVAVAHHADDQVETVLMHFLRGSALPGLTGMPYRRVMSHWDAEIPLVRPLLGIWRNEIDAYVAEIGLTPCEDKTNRDTTYYRNRLRHVLIPELETYNPQVKSAIWRMAHILQDEADWLDHERLLAFKACVTEQGDNRIVLDRSRFLDLPIALQRRVLRVSVEQLCPDVRDVGFEAITRGVNFVEDANPGDCVDWINQLHLAVVQDLLVIKAWGAELPDLLSPILSDIGFEALLSSDNPVFLRHGWFLEATIMPENPNNPSEMVHRIKPDEACLDEDLLDLPLVVRGPREGERFKPLGLGGHSQSLQDFFVNQKIPAHLRSLWPLVVAGDRVAWVVGMRPAEDFKVTDRTTRILKLKLGKSNL